MPLHLAALFESQCAGLFENAGGKTDLPDVVNQTAEMRQILLILIKPHALRDITGVDRNGGRMTRRVAIPRIECRDQAHRERKVRRLELLVHPAEVVGQSALLLVHEEPALSRQRRREEQRKRPGRYVAVSEG